MALDGILATIGSDGDSVVRELEDTATRRVAALADKARAEAIRVEQETAASRNRIAEQEAARLVDRARLEARRASLDAVETAYQEALADLRIRLSSLRGAGSYPVILARLLDEGLSLLPDATGVDVDPADVELMGSLLAERGRSEVEVVTTSSRSGGLDLLAADGRLLRNTFESRLGRADRQLRQLVAEQLADGGTT
ncbi:MAG: V-type ATP synthase subunit E family protein [Acidimicrobiia bacterium]|nr:V-type ATP synthase subunit E family protein [Acidimicrobiia bacterium]